MSEPLMEFSDHLSKAWFVKAREVNGKIDNVHLYGIKSLIARNHEFHRQNLHLFQPYEEGYKPNPWRYQYDLTFYIWLEYYSILDEEIKLLRKEGKDEKADELSISRTLYGITRTDFLFAAAELRWPTTVSSDGKRMGLFIRDPWSEDRAEGISDPDYNYLFCFGGLDDF
jgi:hypothetical protein